MDTAVEHRVAVQRAADLWALGVEAGTGAAIWAQVIADELKRYDTVRGQIHDKIGGAKTWMRLHGSSMVIVVAVAQVAAFGRRVGEITCDPELDEARAQFKATAGDAIALRHVVVHLDEYAVGSGRRQTNKLKPAISERNVSPCHMWMETVTGSGGATQSHETALFELGDDTINVHAAGNAAIRLAEVVERVRERHMKLAEDRAQLAVRRKQHPLLGLRVCLKRL